MFVWDVPLADHVVELLHGTLPRIMHLSTGATHEKTIVRGMSPTPTLLESEPLPATEISMLGRYTMSTRFRWHTATLVVLTTIRVRRFHIRRSIAGWFASIRSSGHIN